MFQKYIITVFALEHRFKNRFYGNTFGNLKYTSGNGWLIGLYDMKSNAS